MKKRNNFWTKNACAEEALKYQYKSDFQKQSKGAYLKAMRQGWLQNICLHMVPKPFVAKGGKPGKAAHNRVDLVGQKFGKWTVLSRAGVGKKFGWIVKCDCGTEAEVAGQNLRNGNSTKCSKCSNQISNPMRELYQYILDLGLQANLSDRSNGFEIDILVPEKNFFIEYDGLLWHSSKFRATAALEQNRFNKFKQTGLTGMRIFEDQYLQNPELVKAMVANRLGFKPQTKASDYNLVIVTAPVKFKNFCKKYHLDGYGRSSWAVVALSGNEVLAFMGFRPYMAGKFKGQPELSRFCTNYSYDCYGLFGKMLKLAIKHIRQNNLGTCIVSASDNHISYGKVYANNGFTQHGPDTANWFYYLHSKGLRMHRAMGRKLKPPKITPEEYAKYPTESIQVSSGFTAGKKFKKWEPMYKVYGWGQKLWVRHL